ncbi:MAG: glycosyltransferase family protein [Thioalkalispiraceae bacterium]
MARIVYGVSGEGSGHSSRAREIVTHLINQGHEIKVASYDRGYRNLCDDFDVHEIAGLTIVSQDNKVSPIRTLLTNLRGLPDGVKTFRKTRKKLFKHFRPDFVFSDFEPTTAYLANYYKIPLISLDNQHRMRYMDYSKPAEYLKDALVTETVIRAMVPRPDISLVTTFHFGEVKNNHTFLFPPILRESVLALTPEMGNHILVYATSGFESLLSRLKQFAGESFIVYGYDKEQQDGNIIYRPFSKQGFLDDLASCKAVIATAGFTLITESLYLAKPYLALPMEGQFEQVLNALMLDDLGYGKASFTLTDNDIADFLNNLPGYYTRLQSYPHEGNSKILSFIDSLLKDDGKKLCQIINQ